MNTWLALFRGINVGGNNKLLMKDLVLTFDQLGFGGIKTYIQSGNVVFQSTSRSALTLSKTIAAALETDFGMTTQVMVLSAKELSEAINANPFDLPETEATRLHLYFLSQPALRLDHDRLESICKANERWKFIGNVFYLHTPDGAGNSKLAANVEKIVGVPVTARNWRTCCTLHDMLTSHGKL